MRRAALLLTFGALAPLVALSVHAAAPQRALILTSEARTLSDADDCEHFHTQNVTSFPAQAHTEEQREVSLSGIDLVKVRATESGGILVRGWDRPVARLTVCKYAVGFTQPQADRSLSNVAVSIHNGEIAASGPDVNSSNVWWVHMILRVPRRANLELASANGGIAIRNMLGHVTAHATNGGISLASCAGENRLTTGSGGISLDMNSGSIDATTDNGPISLKLHRDHALPTIDARIDDDRGEILCNVKACAAGWTLGKRHLRVGSAAPFIRLATGRAAIVIEQVR
jgi:hypothetical protein